MSPQKVLVFQPSFIGDSILATPLLKVLHHHLPHSQIFFCVRPEAAPLFEGLPFITQVISYDKRKKQKGLRGLWEIKTMFNSLQLNIVFSLHKSARSSLLMSLTQAPLKIGFKEAFGANLVYHKTFLRSSAPHEVEKNLKLLQGLWDPKELTLPYHLRKPETFLNTQALETFQKMPKPPHKKIVGICPTSVWPTKKWPLKKFITLSERLYEQGVLTALFAAPNEMDQIKEFKSVSFPFLNLAGQVPLRDLPAYFKALDLVITNDSAPLHIAVSQGTPTVAIFGPTTKELGFYPYDSQSHVIERPLSCRPCGLHGGKACPQKHFRCMNDISVEEVFNHCQQILFPQGVPS